MQIPGSSSAYYGGSVAYNTRHAQKLLLDNKELHSKLLKASSSSSSPAEDYINSKKIWTEECAKAFVDALDVDYAIAEGGASGPTFRPSDLQKGFAVVAIAGRRSSSPNDGTSGGGKGPLAAAELLAQTVIRSDHANRSKNMKLFANEAAKLAIETIGIKTTTTTTTKTDDDGENKHLENTSKATTSASAGLWLDRATHLRTNDEALQTLEERPDAKCVVIKNSNECLMTTAKEKGGGITVALVPLSTIVELLSKSSSSSSSSSSSKFPLPKSFLGLNPNGSPIYVVDVNDKTNSDVIDGLVVQNSDSGFENIRTHAPLLVAHENELVLYATALSQWKRTHKFCPTTGHELVETEGGTCLESKTDDGRAVKWWPRMDPSIIVLVTNRDGTKVLLARSPRHPDKMHTALAGFVEAGETMEQAVIREVYEETKIRVDPDSITYLSSQPWPFPRSCMLAFRATADDTNQEICIDEEELTSADWFNKQDVELATTVQGAVMNKEVAAQALVENPNLTCLIPPTGVVARTLIDDWLDDL
mmetsp:Transcript_27017/g.64525  ORF Transcript_27017/g.64525 Transcript_27017/m.64525 type:complete len:534 (-) Transcript_27017:86-1687(-)